MEIQQILEQYSGEITCEIEMKLPSLNDYIRVCRRNRYESAKFKKDLEEKIAQYMLEVPTFTDPVKIHFIWVEGNKKRDLDNVCFSKKFILDSMVKYGKLRDDNRKCVTAFTDDFVYGDKTSVVLLFEVIRKDKWLEEYRR